MTRTTITVHDEKMRVYVEYQSDDEIYRLWTEENPTYRLAMRENDIRELKVLIDDILHYVNQRDY